MSRQPSRGRADQKLEYAGIHLGELRSYPGRTSNDAWENAHQESCLFHLAGAVDALLHEINEAYSLGLQRTNVHWGSVSRSLRRAGRVSPAFNRMSALREQKGEWLDLLYEWRNHGTHRGRVGKVVYVSTTRRENDNEFKDPRDGSVPGTFSGLGCQQVLECLAAHAEQLVEDCRRIDPELRCSE